MRTSRPVVVVDIKVLVVVEVVTRVVVVEVTTRVVEVVVGTKVVAKTAMVVARSHTALVVVVVVDTNKKPHPIRTTINKTTSSRHIRVMVTTNNSHKHQLLLVINRIQVVTSNKTQLVINRITQAMITHRTINNRAVTQADTRHSSCRDVSNHFK